MNNTNAKLLAEYIQRNFVNIYYTACDSYFEGMVEFPSLDSLLNLEALVKMAIEEKRREE
jgi:hypothetical protein